ncbi:uncharacterized protein LOC114931855, partial [Nylanderia fulva]|uniref:uncharacterized protein LOC114931855 n=1 Tax=Nylanderia fulva TaxID=613905 RepID=UPI0010FB5B2C
MIVIRGMSGKARASPAAVNNSQLDYPEPYLGIAKRARWFSSDRQAWTSRNGWAGSAVDAAADFFTEIGTITSTAIPSKTESGGYRVALRDPHRVAGDRGPGELCLAQISNTLLKQFSYNEIHNRRVALGITCVQCTPVQLEILRRAGAMPVSSRRCGMITRREAERLCKSFLGDNAPPRSVGDDARNYCSPENILQNIVPYSR